jgi:hypothetical protein
MSDWWEDIDEFICDHIECPYCGTKPPYWCVTKSGRVAQWLHSDRQWPLRNLISKAYDDGIKEGREWERRARDRQERQSA